MRYLRAPGRGPGLRDVVAGMIRCPCGFVAPNMMHFHPRPMGDGCKHGAAYTKRLAQAELSARFDQIQAACQAEGRAPTEAEWAELRRMDG